MIPKEVRYLQTHEWARREPDTGIVTVGISHFAVEQLGDIEQLPEKLDLFKSDPYGNSWMVKVKPTKEQEFESLMDAKQYEEYLKEL